MLKLFIGKLLPDIPHTEVLYPNLGNVERGNAFKEKIFRTFMMPVVELVNEPELADYFCIPHNYNYIKNNLGYISEFVTLAQKYSKNILIFFPGDSDEDVAISNAIVFRNSQYGYKKKPNEVMIPAYAMDLCGEGVLYRNKGAFPVVGFCGWADFCSLKQRISYAVKCFLEKKEIRKPGLYFRRKALRSLSGVEQVKTNFIIRKSYSLSEKTISLDPKIARKEYIENMRDCDFVLAPKGDGNFSVRFFEALSLGRIPLLIDTDCVLPLADEINYDDFILRVPLCDLDCLPARVSEFYSKLQPDQFLLKQRKGRDIFDTHLKIEKFFAHVMTKEFLSKL